MGLAIEKLFKGYTVKEIEEIVFKAALAANKNVKNPYPQIIKPLPPSEKREWAM